jgi:hypothetical protein
MKMFMKIHKDLRTFSNFHLVWKFNKSIYGLKQFFRAWYQRLYYYLIFQAFTRFVSLKIYISNVKLMEDL